MTFVNLKKEPLVTIGIPSYNRADMLKRAIESALSQDYKNIEVVISDDASPEPAVRELLKQYEAHPRVRCEYFENNVGLVGNWQRCLELARGDLWLALPNDDWLEPSAISRMVAAFENPAVGLAVCGYHKEEGDDVVERTPGKDGVVSGREFIRDRLRGKCGYPPAEMYRLDLIRKVGGYQSIGYAMDLMLELDVSSVSDVAYINQALVHNIRHPETASASHPVAAMSTLVTLAKMAADRYPDDIARDVYANSLRCLLGRTLEGAIARNRHQTQAGVKGLKELHAPLGMLVKARVLNVNLVQSALCAIRKLKRAMWHRPARGGSFD